MRDYEKPVLVHNDEAFEGVYAASGAVAGANCYKVTAYIHQRPETGRETFVIQVNADHEAIDGHHNSGDQILTLSFNKPVYYVSSQGSLSGGDGTASINITYNCYHNNGVDHIGLGDVQVKSADGADGLDVTGAVLTCNYHCSQH